MEEDGTPAGAEGGLPKLDKMSAGAEGGLPKLESTEPVLKQQQKKKPPKVEPHEGGSDLQQLVNTLSQALKQSMVASSEQSEVRRNVRAPRVYSVGQNFKTWLSQFMITQVSCTPNRWIVERICLHYWTNRPTKLLSCSSSRNRYRSKNLLIS